MAVQSLYLHEETWEFVVDIRWEDGTVQEARDPRTLTAAFPQEVRVCPYPHHDMGETDSPYQICSTLLGGLEEMRQQVSTCDELLNNIYHLSNPMARR